MLFLLVSIAVFNGLALWMRKRVTAAEIYCSVLFSAVFQLLADAYLGVKYGLYGYFDHNLDYRELLVIAGIFPALNIIFLNFFPLGRALRYKAIYILGWSVFSVIYEWATVKTGVFFHSGWKLWYSALAYPLIFVILILHLIFFRYLKRKD